MFNSIFSLLNKYNYFPSLLNINNIWPLLNSNIFLYKLQQYIYTYIYIYDFLQIKLIKIFSNKITFLNLLLFFIKINIFLIILF